MAKEEPEDELEDEIAALEEEIAALEEGEPVDETPDEDEPVPEPEASDDPAASTQEEPAPEPAEEDEEGEGRLSSLVGRFKRGDEDDEADEAAAETDEPPSETEDEDGSSPVAGLVGRLRGGDEDEPASDDADPESEPAARPEEAEETDAPAAEPARETPDTEEAQAPDTEPEPAPAPRAEPALSEEEARRREASARWERVEGGWRRRPDDEIETEPAAAHEDDEDDEDTGSGGAAALLARFRGGDEPADEDEEAADDTEATTPPAYGAADVEPPAEEEEEDEDRSKLVIAAWIIGIIVLIALIAAAAIYLLDGTGGGTDVEAAVTSGALTQDGSFLTATGTAISFDASGTTGEVDEYRWDFDDGTDPVTTQQPTVEHTYASSGTYTVTMTAVAGDTTSEATLEVVVVQAPTAEPSVLLGGEPVAAPGEVGNNVFIGTSVTLDGTASEADPEQSLSSYAWDIDGDGSPEATGETATTSFDAPGRWIVNLTVTDDLGNTGTANQTVHVSDIQRFENETVGPALTGPTSNLHNVTVDAARLGATPVELSAVLNYTSDDGGGGLPTGDPAPPDLDLSVESPGGTEQAAEDDEAGGRETLTISDVSELGEWTFNVTHDNQDGIGGAGQDVTYTLVVRVLY